jgi:TolA-binding protein
MSRNLFLTLMLLPSLAPAASKEMIALQLAVDQIQKQLTMVQQSVDSKTGAIQVVSQQALDAATRANASVADLQRGTLAGSAELAKQFAQQAAATSARIDAVGQDVQGLQTSVGDLSGRVNKMQQQLADILQAIKSMQAPAAPPITDGGSPPAGGGAPPVSAEQLWQNAQRDMDGGHADLALQEFTDYLKFYRTTPQAPEAQYNIGQIHYFQTKLDLAIQDFDQVIEAFPINTKSADAHYMKGRALFQMGARADSAKEFRIVIEQFPRSPVAANCKEMLKLATPAPRTR